MIEEGNLHRLRQRRWVICMEGGADLAVASLDAQMETQHSYSGCDAAAYAIAPALLPHPSVEYRVALPRTDLSIKCTVEEFSGRANSIPNLWMNFMHWHAGDTIVILNEGTLPHPWRDQCAILILPESLAVGNLGDAMFKR